jgi:putative chitinase
MDKPAFFAAVRNAPFGGALSQSAVDGIEAILTAWETYGDADANKLAYILASAFHESDRFKTMEEYASGKAYEGRKDLGNTQSGDGVRFKGRGFVQITGRRNYSDWSERLCVDLLTSPDLAESRPLAARILVQGSMLGTFTGKKLGDYITGSKVDFKNARRVINGTDKADLIAGYAEKFALALRKADVPTPAPDTGPIGQSLIASLVEKVSNLEARVSALETAKAEGA